MTTTLGLAETANSKTSGAPSSLIPTVILPATKRNDSPGSRSTADTPSTGIVARTCSRGRRQVFHPSKRRWSWGGSRVSARFLVVCGAPGFSTGSQRPPPPRPGTPPVRTPLLETTDPLTPTRRSPMSDEEPGTSLSPESSPPRSGRGGHRPGAGRPRKIRPRNLANPNNKPPVRPVPTVGSIAWFWDRDPDPSRRSFVPRPSFVLEVSQPGDPESALTLIVFAPTKPQCEVLERIQATLNLSGEGGCWSWPL
jgi:hypothetical protein